MMSRIHPDKGHEQFIRAAAVVAAHTPAARFVIYGDCLPTYEPLRREFEALIEELGLSGRAQIMPGLTRAEVATTLRTADVVVVPSTWVEPGGLVVLEGMASAAPVIAPDRGGPAEVITDGVDGFLVAPTNTAMLAATIERLLADPDLRRVIGRRALERVTAEYGLDTQIPRLTRLYDELTSTTEWRQCA
jgi:glycosyltransferase involved in cell wall biosynthesis